MIRLEPSTLRCRRSCSSASSQARTSRPPLVRDSSLRPEGIPIPRGARGCLGGRGSAGRIKVGTSRRPCRRVPCPLRSRACWRRGSMACPTTSAALEHGSAEGRFFHRGAVEHLSDQTTPENVSIALGRLVRKAYLRPRSRPADQTAFRFRHILIRDAAYGTTPKKVRAKPTRASSTGPNRSWGSAARVRGDPWFHLGRRISISRRWARSTRTAPARGSSRREAVVRRAQELRRGNVPAASTCSLGPPISSRDRRSCPRPRRSRRGPRPRRRRGRPGSPQK